MTGAMNLRFYTNPAITVRQFADLLRRAGRPACAEGRGLERLITNSNLVLTAFAGNKLVGLVRALSDFASCCYIADLVVDQDFGQALGGSNIETLLLREVSKEIDGNVKLINPFSLDGSLSVSALA